MKNAIELSDTSCMFSPVMTCEGIEIYTLPSAGTYRWKEELKGVFSTWTPLSEREHSIKQWFSPNESKAAYQYGAPLLATIDSVGKNCVTVALSDSVSRSKITVCVDDLNQNDEIVFTVVYEGKPGGTQLRIDRRPLDWDDVVYDAGVWMRTFIKHLAPIPDYAKLPLYSSWYSFHQEPEQHLLERELETAAEMGFKTFILDDGWQYEGKSTGDYSFCGDWNVAKGKFPDFKAFCDKVHSLGLRMLMWFPVPFVGYNTEDYQKLKNRIAYNSDSMRAGILDVRYPAVREYIIGIYKQFVSAYKIDGLKLDFIDSFMADPKNIPAYSDEMDTDDLDKAVQILMDEIYAEMTENNPEFLIEFRQNYVGAEIVNHCNMLRVMDCATDSISNRIGIAELKLVNSNTAIHSDMLLWGHNETPLNCARQLLNILFSVPQISVRLTELSKEQREVLHVFLKYWTDNKEILSDGYFKAKRPDANYSAMSAAKNEKRITVLYSDGVFEPRYPNEDIFNNTEREYIVCSGGEPFSYQIHDMVGRITKEGKSNGRTERFDVPCGGMLAIVSGK